MKLITQQELDAYLENDWVLDLLEEAGKAEDKPLATQQWLEQTPAKRLLFSALYGDLLDSAPHRRVLDIGGGISTVTRALAHANDYRIVDILAHGGAAIAAALEAELGRKVLTKGDWLRYAEASSDHYDVVVANDIFPNCDQRLELFLEAFLPRTRELRVSLTFYDRPRYYLCRRLDAEEILCMLAWDGQQIENVLSRQRHAIFNPDFTIFKGDRASVYPNGRHVCLVTFKGGGFA